MKTAKLATTLSLILGLAFAIHCKASDTILVVHSYEKGSWTIEGTSGVRNFFSDKKKYVIHEYIYDYVKFRSKPASKDSFKNAVNALRPSLIIIFDDEATEDLLPLLTTSPTPVVLTGINRDLKSTSWFLPENHPRRNFTGILERYPFEQSLKMLKKIKPSVKSISILTSDNETSRIVSSQIISKFKSYNNSFMGIKLNDVTKSSSWEQWKSKIRTPNSDAFWILVPWNVNDSSGKEVDIRVIGDFYREHSKIPEIGIVNISDKLGFVSSFSVNAEDLGLQAGQVALKILEQKINPSSMPFAENSMVRFVINKKRADQLGITIPTEFLDFAKIERKIPREYFR